MDEVLIDTNVPAYAHRPAETSRHARAVEIVETLIDSGGGAPALRSGAQAALLSEAFPVFDLTRFIVLEAARGLRRHRLSYWDAQSWATARFTRLWISLDGV